MLVSLCLYLVHALCLYFVSSAENASEVLQRMHLKWSLLVMLKQKPFVSTPLVRGAHAIRPPVHAEQHP